MDISLNLADFNNSKLTVKRFLKSLSLDDRVSVVNKYSDMKLDYGYEDDLICSKESPWKYDNNGKPYV